MHIVRPLASRALPFIPVLLCCVPVAYRLVLYKSENRRRWLREHCPACLRTFYYTEDLFTFGQLSGSRLRAADLHRWTGAGPKGLESD